MFTRSIGIVTVLVLILFIAGCICDIDGGRCPSGQHCTAGQELIDLKKAYDQGAITQEEYYQKKNQILSDN